MCIYETPQGLTLDVWFLTQPQYLMSCVVISTTAKTNPVILKTHTLELGSECNKKKHMNLIYL